MAYKEKSPIPVVEGGTGAQTLTGVLIGNGTSPVTANTVTQYNTLVGGASNAITSIAPSATSGVPLVSGGASANPSYTTAVVAGGGTGATSFTAYAPICGGTTTTGVLQSAATGISTSGFVLTSNGASALPSFQAAAGGITTLAGDSGTATGSTVTIAGGTNLTSSATSSTVTINLDNLVSLPNTTSNATGIYAINSVPFLHAYATTADNNIWAGNAGNFTMTSGSCIQNVGIGHQAMASVAIEQGTVAIGYQALTAQNSGSTNGNNVAIGYLCLTNATGTAGSTSVGWASLTDSTTGIGNTALGYRALRFIATSGSYNLGLGFEAGVSNTSTVSSNVYINSPGTNSESNVLQIGAGTGTSTQQLNKAVICGITGKTSASGIAVLVNSSNVLGTTTSSIKYKERIKNIGTDSEKLYDLRPVSFHYKDEITFERDDENLKQYGLIAEEVIDHYPELITYDKDGKIDSIRYHMLYGLMLNEIQKLKKRIEKLERSI